MIARRHRIWLHLYVDYTQLFTTMGLTSKTGRAESFAN